MSEDNCQEPNKENKTLTAVTWLGTLFAVFFTGSDITGIVLPDLFQNCGMLWTTASVSSIIQASGPIFTILLAVWLLKEPLGANKILGTVTAFT